jgi:hypothetical protein
MNTGNPIPESSINSMLWCFMNSRPIDPADGAYRHSWFAFNGLMSLSFQSRTWSFYLLQHHEKDTISLRCRVSPFVCFNIQSGHLWQVCLFCRIAVGSWNVAGLLPPDDIDLHDWLDTTPPADIYVIGWVVQHFQPFRYLKNKYLVCLFRCIDLCLASSVNLC